MSDGCIWGHVSSEDNPADCASRGITPQELATHSLWWNGPEWLAQAQGFWPQQQEVFKTMEEEVVTKQVNAAIQKPETYFMAEFLSRFSSFMKAKRVMAYVLRWHTNPTARANSHVTVTEIGEAEVKIIRGIQQELMSAEYNALLKDRQVSRNSRLLSLTPFIDSQGTIRVGGRLQNASLSENRKHPMILPRELAKLALNEAHRETLYGNPSLTLAHFRQRYWTIGGKNLVKTIINNCIICAKQKAIMGQQKMGNLPKCRASASRPFDHVGIDYASPITLKFSPGRETKTTKGYVALFICMSTKAVNLEAVSDLTAETFIAALKRFTSRRGLPSNIYSDNGTNFVKANKMLQETLKCVQLKEWGVRKGIQWHFIPPHSPHMGGLWEAGVKSMKYHLKRIMSGDPLTFEEFTTILAQVEACLNSRPLVPLNESVDDLNFLTPGHFLIGGSLLSHPEPSLLDQNHLHLRRWSRLTKIVQDFCVRFMCVSE